MLHSSQEARDLKHRFTNRLISETSPYLRQHAHNPVDWHPWGPEALERALKEDKPILLSIGYSACHWCHVMERESFENEEIAELMNRHFVNIKVDREERPDLDAIYMNYLLMTTGGGGWPMTVFLTPQQVPFFGGTYFPPNERSGHPGFGRILQLVAHAYQTKRGEIADSAAEITRAIEQMNYMAASSDKITSQTLETAYGKLAQHFDWTNGGFGKAPKFPASMILAFCLRHYHRSNDPETLKFIELTLQKMTCGGLYDQLGGGFHRYSVDQRWLVPHFEKMLYDNALLSRLYLEAYQLTGNRLYGRIARETLDYVRREMFSPDGGFYSTQDADSEGKEGKFFLWKPSEITGVLGKSDGEIFCLAYGVSEQGNLDGSSILHLPRPLEECAEQLDMQPDELEEVLSSCRCRLFGVREQRPKPHRDEKILTSWNGLMIRSFVDAALLFHRPDYLQIAEDSASWVMESLCKNRRLLHTHKDGQAKFNGFLEDYAFFVEALIALFEATGDFQWLDHAVAFNEEMLSEFWDTQEGGFFMTGHDHEPLIVRVKDVFDNALPSGNSAAIVNLLKLSILTGNGSYRGKAEACLENLSTLMCDSPTGFGYLLSAADFYVGPVREIVVAGSRDHPQTQQFMRTIHQRFLPNKIVILFDPANSMQEKLPLLEGKKLVQNTPAVYVCHDHACQAPITSISELEELLEARPGYGAEAFV